MIYFLNGIAVQSEDVLSRAERINALLNQWKIVVASGGSQVTVNIVQHLAINPYFTTNKIAQELSISYSTAQRSVQKLETAGIIKKMNDSKRDKVYCAIEILNILEEPTKIMTDIYNNYAELKTSGKAREYLNTNDVNTLL